MTAVLLKQLRDQVKNRDEKIVKLLHERASLSIKIGEIKKSSGLSIYDSSQESKIYRWLNQTNSGALPAVSLRKIFCEILSTSRALQAPVTVAYLGPDASFSHLAVQSHFGKSASLFPQSNIFDVFDQIEKRKIAWGVVPVENSLEGSVAITLDRLISTPLSIVADIFLSISHCLLSTGKDLKALKRVYSHPQAMAQCQEWLRKNLPHCSLHEVESTSKAAQTVMEDDEGAAIGSIQAAAVNKLSIIAEGIEDRPSNTTRFFVIGEGNTTATGRDKTSIIFGTRHEPGSLYRALEPFTDKEINLMKIVSHPIKDRMWEYLFFVDLTGHQEEKKVAECLEDLKEKCTFFKILGSYPMGDITA
ncbi:MAG: prephenate dehydratase [Thermodesulfobacteriota bacterium]|nr:prephenate dehydratase [Thermodesulfobacteriota bacterium]